MGREDLIGDARYDGISARLQRRAEVESMFSNWTKSLTKREVFVSLGRHGVPCGAVLDTAELLTDTHLKSCDMLVQIEHPEYGPITLPGCPIKISDSAITFTPAPLLGADNAEVYGTLLGLDVTRLQALHEHGVM